MLYDWSKELENMTLGKVCIAHLNDSGEPTLSRVTWAGAENAMFDTVALTPQCPHIYYQGISCVIVEGDTPAFSDLLEELPHLSQIACICLGKPSEALKPMVNLWLEEGVSYKQVQVEACVETFRLPKDAGFQPVTLLLSHLVERLSSGLINVDGHDIIALSPTAKLGYLSVGLSLIGSVVRATIAASEILEQHPPFQQLIACFALSADTGLDALGVAMDELQLIADPDGLIVFGAGFHQRPEAMTYILGF
ncbi:hypothetical protein RFF05_15705 [Bengtsoniella intestinalis]|uniref:hypothetical protein n=1 Tax=Bengtsoniella intestinalis TaxID=3073143 RepID=UPI00391F744F